MKILLALLADHAIAHADGKLYVTGGGIRFLPFSTFPAVMPRLALALGIEVGQDELGIQHTLNVEASGPTDEAIFRPVNVTFNVPRRSDHARYFHFVANMDNVTFEVAGDYSISIAIDDRPLAVVEVRAEQTIQGSEVTEGNAPDDARALLGDGYAAFGQGDTVLAEQLFRKVTGRFPMFPDGHNNLGFTLLAKGDATAALEAFATAKALHYPQPEISDANLGCAMYMSGDAGGAQLLFTECLQNLLATPATLFGIGPSGLFPVEVSSAADYATLMALNAAWSAHVAGDVVATTHYLQRAHEGELLLRADASGNQVLASLGALETEATIRG
jgi:tetratricopeptide (TPR) repeat protein